MKRKRTCSTCWEPATHWTAEVADDGMFLLEWCDKCWSQLGGDGHDCEVTLEAWLEYESLVETMER